MTLAAPHVLWALLLLPLLWWLSQPPKPRRHAFTAHMAQWQLAMKALRRRPPRGSWLRFALLALAFVAATLAAAQPESAATPGAKRLVVLLDASASMGASTVAAAADARPSAFELARRQLRHTFAQLPASIDVTVLRCGGDLLRRHGDAARALHDLGEPAGALQVDLVQLAAELHSEDVAVWTLTDAQGQRELPTAGALTRFDTAHDNAAITAVRITDAWPLPELAIEVDVVAFASEPPTAGITAMLEVEGALGSPLQQSCLLQPGVVQTVSIAGERVPGGGELRCRLILPGDVLASDHRYQCTLPPLPAPSIAAFAEADAGPFAAVAAEALAAEVGGTVAVLDGSALAEDPGRRAPSSQRIGVVLADGGVLPLLDSAGRVAAVRAITFGTRLGEQVEVEPWLLPTPLDWTRDTDLTRGLDLSELVVERAWRNMLPPGEAFLWCHDGEQRHPLAVLVAAGDTASVHFAFRLQDSNLPLLPAFPQLLRRAFVRSYGELAQVVSPSVLAHPDERNLLARAVAPDRPLPGFAKSARSAARWLVVVGMLALLLRALVR